MPIQFLSLQGVGGTAVPYERRNAPYYLSAVATNPQDSLRLKRYEEQWRFYSGIQWSFQREDGEPLVTANYCRRIVDKKASWLCGKGMIIEVPEALNEITKPILDEVWDYNQRDRLLLEMAVTGGVTGDVFPMVTFQPPTTQQKAINPYTQGQIRIRLLGSHQVFPTWNPLNHEEIVHVRIITEVVDQNPLPQEGAEQLRSPITVGSLSVQRKNRYIEDIYPWVIYEGWEDESRRERPNDLGEIGLVHITNQPFPGEFYGLSDLDGIIDIQREYNEKLTDISDIINYHAAPVTVITGARAKQLEKGPKALWAGLPAEAKVFNLDMGSDLPASNQYLETIKTIMFELANLPEGALGQQQPISNTSGAALQVQFQPLIEATERKASSYLDGMQKLNYYILRYHQLMTGEAFPVDLCKHCGGRIVEIRDNGPEGPTIERRCFLINPQTLQFMEAEEVKLNWKRKLSFGTDSRMLTMAEIRKDYARKGESYWDPEDSIDEKQKALDDQERERALQEFQRQEEMRTQEEQAENEEDARAKQTTEADGMGGGGEMLPAEEQQETVMPAEPARLPPEELLPDPEQQVEPEQLSAYDMDIPEEPIELPVTVMEWNAMERRFVQKDLGTLLLVPSGCDRPRYLNPYESTVTFKSALPRDMEKATNLYSSWQENGWVSRRWIQEKLDEDINIRQVDKEIADDIPFILALQGKPDPTAQVAQTAGIQDGQVEGGISPVNGAPPPAMPGPGRGNKFAPGDNLAGGGSPPPTAAPGDRM